MLQPWTHLKLLGNWLVSALFWLASHTLAQAGMLMQVSREPEVAVDYTDGDYSTRSAILILDSEETTYATVLSH